MEEKIKDEFKKIVKIIEKYERKKLPENFIDDIKEYNKLVKLDVGLPYEKFEEQYSKIKSKIGKKINKIKKKYGDTRFMTLAAIERDLKKGENTDYISFKLETAFEIANKVNNNFYEGRKVVDPYLVFIDIYTAEESGSTYGGALDHRISQDRKEGKIGKLKVPAELIYRKIDRVLSTLFGDQARIKEHKESLIEYAYVVGGLLKSETYKKVFTQPAKFSEENYKDPKIKKEIFDQIEWTLDRITPEDMNFLTITYNEYMKRQLDNAGIEYKKTNPPLRIYCETINKLLSEKKK